MLEFVFSVRRAPKYIFHIGGVRSEEISSEVFRLIKDGIDLCNTYWSCQSFGSAKWQSRTV